MKCRHISRRMSVPDIAEPRTGTNTGYTAAFTRPARQATTKGRFASLINELKSGGRKRNRTAVRGFAVLCIATLPSGREASHIGWGGKGGQGAGRGSQGLCSTEPAFISRLDRWAASGGAS